MGNPWDEDIEQVRSCLKNVQPDIKKLQELVSDNSSGLRELVKAEECRDKDATELRIFVNKAVWPVEKVTKRLAVIEKAIKELTVRVDRIDSLIAEEVSEDLDYPDDTITGEFAIDD